MGDRGLAQDVLIVGSAAGLRAALDLADAGLRVHLIESSPFLGNRGTGCRSVPQQTGCQPVLQLEVVKHPRVTVWTNTTLTRLVGEGADLRVEIRRWPRRAEMHGLRRLRGSLPGGGAGPGTYRYS